MSGRKSVFPLHKSNELSTVQNHIKRVNVFQSNYHKLMDDKKKFFFIWDLLGVCVESDSYQLLNDINLDSEQISSFGVHEGFIEL